MDYNKYKNDGWGLSELALQKIEELIKNNNLKRIIEFGSGTSTEFLSDLNVEISGNLDITSFDNSPIYAYKPKENDCVKLLMRDLVECNDNDYAKMFSEKRIISSLFHPKTSPLSTRQKNNFYEIKDGDITGQYVLMILDGSNGNGRNFAFLYMKNHMKKGGYIFIDDFNHYDFVEKCLECFNAEIIFKYLIERDRFIILRKS